MIRMDRQLPNTILMSPAGDLTAECAPGLASALRNALADRASVIRLDLSRVKEVDWRSLLVLADFSRVSDRSSVLPRLQVVTDSQDVEILLRVTRLSEKWRVERVEREPALREDG